jgi:hypothetical protein
MHLESNLTRGVALQGQTKQWTKEKGQKKTMVHTILYRIFKIVHYNLIINMTNSVAPEE